MPKRALIIDDEADIRELIAMSLDRIGLDTHTASNLAEAHNLLDTYNFDVCLTDMKLPDGNGVEFVKHALKVQPELPVAVITAHGNIDAAVEAMKNGAFDFASKPVDIGLLRDLVTQAIGLGCTQNEEAQSHASCLPEGRFTPRAVQKIPRADSPSSSELSDRKTDSVNLKGNDRLIGHSEPMRHLKKLIVKVSRTNAPVWITGESGTGKELIAQLVHENGSRKNAPFVAINCGAIPSELMESEMFGHLKGSFTGAHSDHDGLFRRAAGGTLFLDEVAELPLPMQVKLLRAIQERKIRPVGSSDEINTNVRILSASHKDLADEVDRGHFRHDLYYRLNVISIRAPSLRQRSDDVIMIARHILQSIAKSENMPYSPSLSKDAEIQLSAYSFPGNVRELENILERAVALSDAESIEVFDLNLTLNSGIHLFSAEQGNTIAGVAANDSGERELIVRTLAETRWNRRAAAEKLGLTYRQLRYRIQQYGINVDKTDTNF